jgi:hypothetical protein
MSANKMTRPTRSRGKRFLIGALTYLGIIAVTLFLLDVVCIALGLFPPTHNYGDADLGWRPAAATGQMAIGRCIEFSTRQTMTYVRNDDGVRASLTRAQILADTGTIRIAITGDSQTDLCVPNPEVHSGVLESELVRAGVPAVVLPYGSGKYSPLQDYLAFRKVLRPYGPQVLVINLYTGNDLYDILRVDDRPHFVNVDDGYRIAKPTWFLLDDPNLHRRSRVLFAIKSLADKFGIRRIYFRLSELRQLAIQHGGGQFSVIAYIRDIWKARDPSLGYSDAFTAQILNQQLFFHHFPSGKDESIRRVRALMAMVRSENPDLTLVLSPLPSYQLTGEQPVDSALIRTLERLPISYEEGIRQEKELYERLRGLASEQGWVFIDNLKALQEYRGTGRLYNDFDYHLLPPASALVGRAQAAALLDALRWPNHVVESVAN